MLIGAGVGLWHGTAGAAVAAMLGALVLAGVNRFIERASARLAGTAAQETEIDAEAGVRRPSAASVEASSGRAGVILALAASRFWLALLVLTAVLLIVQEHRGAVLGGFIAAVVLDSFGRLGKGLAAQRVPRA